MSGENANTSWHYAPLSRLERTSSNCGRSHSSADVREPVHHGNEKARSESGARQRIRYTGFPAIKTITDFDFTAQPALDRAQIARLEGGGWLAEARNVVLLGPPGTGKTHLAIALGIKAAEAAYPVAFNSATGWINRLAAAHARGDLERELRRIHRFRLLVVDEVGYLPFDAAAASLFFQLIANRYETGSVIVTSNLPFSRWGETLGDDVVAAATIDRLVHHAKVIALDGDSYRTRAHRTGPPPTARNNN